jgi:hypothetical protein
MNHPYSNSPMVSSGPLERTAPLADGEILDAIFELNRVLDGLEVSAGSIFNRLVPVLQPELPPQAATCGSAGAIRVTPIGTELARIQGRIERMHQQASDIGSRLALP